MTGFILMSSISNFRLGPGLLLEKPQLWGSWLNDCTALPCAEDEKGQGYPPWAGWLLVSKLPWMLFFLSIDSCKRILQGCNSTSGPHNNTFCKWVVLGCRHSELQWDAQPFCFGSMEIWATCSSFCLEDLLGSALRRPWPVPALVFPEDKMSQWNWAWTHNSPASVSSGPPHAFQWLLLAPLPLFRTSRSCFFFFVSAFQ